MDNELHRRREASSPDAETVDIRQVASDSGRSRRATPSFAPGSQFGDYELLGEIGRGGMGAVYKARQKSLDRLVALKLILPSLMESEEYVEHLYAEARAAAKIRHPNSVGVYEVGEESGQHYIAMEYVAGKNLAQSAEESPMDAATAALLVLTVARAVAHLHAYGIVHRDLKPSNILVDDKGEPYVTDFGVAKFFKSNGEGPSEVCVVGTPNYMSPEQAAGKDRFVGPLSDVYSLGAILYELLCGRPPFSDESPMNTLVRVVEKDPDLPSKVRSGIPRPLELICLKCLDKRRQRRYRSAGDLADDLQRFLDGELVAAQPWTLGRRFERWMRREPALASRLLPMALFFLVELAWYHAFEFVDWTFHRNVLILLGVWAAASVLFQRWVQSPYLPTVALYCWAGADNFFLAAINWTSHNAASPLTACYFLLIAASGFFYRVPLVWFVTIMAMGTYLVFALLSSYWSPEYQRPVDHHAILLVCQAVLGFMIGRQVIRVRRMSRYYRRRWK